MPRNSRRRMVGRSESWVRAQREENLRELQEELRRRQYDERDDIEDTFYDDPLDRYGYDRDED